MALLPPQLTSAAAVTVASVRDIVQPLVATAFDGAGLRLLGAPHELSPVIYKTPVRSCRCHLRHQGRQVCGAEGTRKESGSAGSTENQNVVEFALLQVVGDQELAHLAARHEDGHVAVPCPVAPLAPLPALRTCPLRGVPAQMPSWRLRRFVRTLQACLTAVRSSVPI